MSLNCPKCNSENTQKLSITYQGGISNNQSEIVGLGVGRGIGGGVATATGTSITDLAQRYAPPAKKSLSLTHVGLILFVGLILSGFFSFSFLIAIAIVIGIYISNAKHNSEVFPAEFAEWDGKFLCLRCENVFTPSVQLAKSE